MPTNFQKIDILSSPQKYCQTNSVCSYRKIRNTKRKNQIKKKERKKLANLEKPEHLGYFVGRFNVYRATSNHIEGKAIFNYVLKK